VSTSGLPRNTLSYAVALPLALVVGYLLATPLQIRSLTLLGLVIACLSLPIFLRWHHPLLIFAWNANITVFFLPGKPTLWMLFAGISLAITVLTCVLDKRFKFQHVPSITWPLLFLVAVVVITAKLTGGIGLRSMGGAMYGGKKFVFIIAAVIGYFALSGLRIDPSRIPRLTGVYFLSALTGVVANLVYLAGPAFYFLYFIFPVDNALGYAIEDLTLGDTGPRFSRLVGAAAAGPAAVYFLVMRYGIRGLLDFTKPWRMVATVALVGLSLLGGFRSVLLMLGLLFLIQFYLEGLLRTRVTIVLLVGGLIVAALLVPLAGRLPLSVQRSISFLPYNVDPAVRANAEASTQWRLEMWDVLLDDVPRYLWIGKGYAIDPTDLYFSQQAARRGVTGSGTESAMVAGDYHSGPLSILIPFGIFGVVGFLWFVTAGCRLLYRNFKASTPQTLVINRFLLSYFCAKVIFYVVGFGALHSDIAFFTGVLGLSVAINGGVKRPAAAHEPSGFAVPAPA
jgi:O-antigen ligase/polysaccharide polymerase Wzy-like membrane protein